MRSVRPRTFDRLESLANARRILAEPVALPWIERPRPIGGVVARFALPLGLCPTSNGTRRKPDWFYVRQRDGLFQAMLPGFLESRRVRGKPLSGRPQVHAVRLCPAAPDALSDWGKSAIDRLIMPLRFVRKGVWVDCKRFGMIEDDRPALADVKQWWEPCPAALGCVLITVRTGAYVG
jgi:hypothetical protein